MTSTMGTTYGIGDAIPIIDQALAAYGLSGLAGWAWGEITNGASASQVLVDMYQTPQFAQRFPGIIARQKAGLPPIAPAEYINYEDQAKQLENRYGLPTGLLSNANTIGDFIGKDISAAELTDRVQKGYAAVAYAPPEVRQAYTAMFGANGDGALAGQMLDMKTSTDILTQQATAAQISGQASMGGINMDTAHAMQLAREGQTGTSVGSNLADLQKNASLYDANINEKPGMAIGSTGIEAEFGMSGAATQQVIQRQQQRQAEFQGGGKAYGDTTGQEGVGAARPM
jgi:hypothetical protein